MQVDFPILSVFLVLNATAAATSLLLAVSNRRKGSDLATPIIAFLFAGERVLACAVRMAWASRPVDIRIAVSSQVLLQAGAPLVLLLNLILAEKVWLGPKPAPCTCRCLRVFLGGVSTMTISALVMVVVAIVVSVYSLDQHTIDRCRDVQRGAASYILALAVAPAAMLVVASVISPAPKPRCTRERRSKVAIVLASCILCTFSAGFKFGVMWAQPKPLFDPAWYHSRTCLYTFVLGAEALALVLLLSARVDQGFSSPVPLGNESERQCGMKTVEEKQSSASSADTGAPRDVA